jgi:hypothetical protein
VDLRILLLMEPGKFRTILKVGPEMVSKSDGVRFTTVYGLRRFANSMETPITQSLSFSPSILTTKSLATVPLLLPHTLELLLHTISNSIMLSETQVLLTPLLHRPTLYGIMQLLVLLHLLTLLFIIFQSKFL